MKVGAHRRARRRQTLQRGSPGIGGDNYTDLPHVRVERFRDGGDPGAAEDWISFADGTLCDVQRRNVQRSRIARER